MPNTSHWVVQNAPPDDYIDKNIDSVYFIVKNHPLSSLADDWEVYVEVWLYENEVIGGFTNPVNKETMYGEVYTIHGQTLKNCMVKIFTF